MSETRVESVACFPLALSAAVARVVLHVAALRCAPLCRTSGFVDDVMLSRDAQQRHGNSPTCHFDDFVGMHAISYDQVGLTSNRV